jgi:hypothetical protein
MSDVNLTLGQKMYTNEKLRMQKIMDSNDFTNEELKACVAEVAARAAVTKSLLDYILSTNSTLITDGENQLKKTGIYSGELTPDMVEKLFQAFDAGILTQKSDNGRRAKAEAYKETDDARKWVLGEWDRKGLDEYDNNKTEFANKYVDLISVNFLTKKLKPLKVSSQTIYKWLPNTSQKGRPKNLAH